MKYLMLSLLAASTASYAQATGPTPRAGSRPESSPQAGHFRFGVKGGPSRGDLQSAHDALFFSTFESAVDFHAGVSAQYRLTRFTSLQSELLYARQGFRGTYNNAPIGSILRTRLNYLAVPLLFVGNLTPGISLHLGPQLAVLTSARTDGQRLDLARSAWRRFAPGGIVGLEAGGNTLRMGVRCVYDFTRLATPGTAVTVAGQPVRLLAADNDYHPWVMQAYLGLGFVR